MSVKGHRVILSVAAMLVAAGAAAAGPFTAGNVVVYRVGDGVNPLANTGNAVFVDEFTPAGVLVQSVALNAAVVGGPNLLASGTATSEGLLTVSPNGRYITVTGYNRELGGSGAINSTTSAAVNRTIAVIDATTGAATYTLLNDWASANNPRSAVTDDGVNLWMAGGAGGVRYAQVGDTTTTQLFPTAPATLANFRQVNIFDGQLYADNASGAGGNTIALGGIGTGLPTTSGQTYNDLPGLPAPATGSAYGFFFADLDATVDGVDTLYIANDNGLGLHKYSLVAGVWQSNGQIGVAADAYRGLAGIISETGEVTLYATRRGGSAAAGGGELVSLIDASGYNGAFTGTPTLLASALTGTNANTAFRGVGVVVPAPGTLALLGVGGLIAARRRRA